LKLTPKVLNVYLNAYAENREIKQKENIYQAYLMSRFVWRKKIDIKKMLNIKKEKKVMTDEQMFNQVKVLNAVFGGEVKGPAIQG
jgi:PP-loop superfamily ATP-utilizing enzyme